MRYCSIVPDAIAYNFLLSAREKGRLVSAPTLYCFLWSFIVAVVAAFVLVVRCLSVVFFFACLFVRLFFLLVCLFECFVVWLKIDGFLGL